jgi:hypothetical protein
MSLNDAKDELLLTRYRSGQSPFILRLPMARYKSRDLDEEIFDFHAGKREMHEIIELANFSAHDARHMNVKGAKTQWWAEREALDKRLADLLVNIESIWLGGFRGMFAQQRREQGALAKFQKELQKILSRHLPSRQGRSQCKPLAFDSRILELFTGLGDPSNEELDLDEPLMDLMYFVVDILQFNGEKCAYDEIDFDSVRSLTSADMAFILIFFYRLSSRPATLYAIIIHRCHQAMRHMDTPFSYSTKIYTLFPGSLYLVSVIKTFPAFHHLPVYDNGFSPWANRNLKPLTTSHRLKKIDRVFSSRAPREQAS